MRKTKKQQAMPKSEAESFGIKRNPAIRAPRIYLSEEEVIRIMRKEAAIKKKIGNLIDSMLCDDSQISAMDNIKNKTCLLYTSGGCVSGHQNLSRRIPV